MREPTASRGCLLAFLTAFVTLFVQILVHRMVSAKLLNNYAFLVISLTMLGFAFSGVMLTRWLDPFLARFNDAVNLCAALFVLSLLGSSAVFYQVSVSFPFGVQRAEFVAHFFRSMPFALLFSLPFAASGLILGALLAHRGLPTPQVYFADLMGSALGAFAVIPAISGLGVEASALLACGVLLAGVWLLAPPRAVGGRLVAGAAGLALLLCVGARDRVFHLTYPEGSILALTGKLSSPYGIEHVALDPVARVEVSRIQPPDPAQMLYPALIGGNRTFHQTFERMLTQNNYAFTYAPTYDGVPASLEGIDETIYAAAYQVSSVPRPKVAVIGVGGGFDVLTGLFFDASRIVGVEVNAATVDVLTESYRDYFRPWVEDPRVELVSAEGRHDLSTTDETYDVLQLSGVDSYSGTSAAAHVFSENYLYTEEAFELYLSRLSDQGMLNMMRLEHAPPREMLRALVTAVGALRRAGVERPTDHILMLTQKGGNFTALLVKKTPFTPQEQQRAAEWAEGNPFFWLSASPGTNAIDGNHYQRFLVLGDPVQEARFIASAPFDIGSVNDDRPFFFRYSFWWHLFSSHPLVRGSTPVLELSVLLLVGMVGLATDPSDIFVPLRFLAARGLRAPGAWRYGLFFACVGLGFFAIEIALLQKFGLFLGHPNYALSVVLAVLLLTSGLGSLFSTTIVGVLRKVRFVSYVLSVLILLEYGFLLPKLPWLIGLPFPVRVSIVAVLLLPLGACLGVFVPTGLERLKPEAPAYVPWAWGINGIFSVMAPILSVAFAISWGANALLLAAVPIYLVAGFALPAPRAVAG